MGITASLAGTQHPKDIKGKKIIRGNTRTSTGCFLLGIYILRLIFAQIQLTLNSLF